MILNLWKNTAVFCGCHPEDKTALELVPVKTTFEYRCPKCSNKFTYFEYEKILDKLSSVYEENLANGIIGTLKGERFRISNWGQCEILSDKDGKYELSAKNIKKR